MTGTRHATLGSLLTGLALQGVVAVSGILAARLLGVVDRGYLAFLFVVALVVLQLGSLGLPGAATFVIARGQHGARAVLRRVALTAVVQAAVMVFIQAGVLYLWLDHAPTHAWIGAALSLCATPFVVGHMYGLAVLQGLRHYRSYNEQRALPAVLYSLALAIAFATSTHGYVVIVGLWVAASSLTGAVTILRARRALGAPASGRSRPSLVSMLRFGAVSLLGSFSAVENLQLDQAAVGLLMTPRALGLYVVAVAFSQLPRYLGGSIGLVAYPEVARRQALEDGRRAVWRYLALGVATCGACALVLNFAVGALVKPLFGPAFEPAITAARILLVAAFFQGTRRVLSEGARGLGRGGLGTVAEIAFYLICIPALAVLVSGDDLTRIAIGFAIAEAASFGVLFISVARVRRLGRLAAEPALASDALVLDSAAIAPPLGVSAPHEPDRVVGSGNPDEVRGAPRLGGEVEEGHVEDIV